MTNAYVCGVGANLGTASEGALKFGETVSIPTAAYEVEEYIHGPNIQIDPPLQRISDRRRRGHGAHPPHF